MVELTATINAKQFLKSINEFEKKSLPKIRSIAAQQAATYAAEQAAIKGQKALDDPIPAVFNGKKSKHRRGWIYFEWDERADIKKKNGNVEAMVQLQGFGPAKARAEQQEAMHRQIFGTTEREGITPATPFIIRPSRRLERDKKIPGVPLKLDKFGNLRNYRKTLTKMLNDPQKRFFQVMLNEGGGTGGRRGNGLKLKPGLYMRVLRVRKYRRNAHTRRKGGPYGEGGKKKASIKIITILRYSRVRAIKSKWDFRKDTQTAMRRKYNEAFIKAFNRELVKSRPRNAAGQTNVGLL